MVSCMRNKVYRTNEDTRNHYFDIGDERPFSNRRAHTPLFHRPTVAPTYWALPHPHLL
jgi:hypothetical protein